MITIHNWSDFLSGAVFGIAITIGGYFGLRVWLWIKAGGPGEP